MTEIATTEEKLELRLDGDWRLFRHPKTGAWFVDRVVDGWVYRGGKMHLNGYLAGGWETYPVAVVRI